MYVKVACALALVVGLTEAASAVVLQSLDRATFQSAISGATTLGVQNFDSFPPASTLTYDGFVTYGASNGTPLVTGSFLTSTGQNGLGRTDVGFFLPTDAANFIFDAPVTAFAIDINTFAAADGAYSVTLDTGDSAFSIFEVFPARGTGQFIGFVSSTPFTSVMLRSESGFAYTLDTLIYGDRREVTGVIPEPATWALMIAGFGIVGAAARRRRALTATA